MTISIVKYLKKTVNSMIKYTIFANEGGLACKRTTSKNGPVSYLVTTSEFNSTISTVLNGGYVVKIKGPDVLLQGEKEAILLRDYEKIKNNALLTSLNTHLEFTIKERGFIDVTAKENISKRTNRTKSNNLASHAKVVALTVVVLGTIIVSAAAVNFAARDNLIVPETPKIEYSTPTIALTEDKFIQEPAIILNETEETEIEEIEVEEIPDQTSSQEMTVYSQNAVDPLQYGYLEFEDKSNTKKAATARDLYYSTFEECAHLYGLDAELLLGMGTEERGIHSDKIDSQGGIGIMQIQYDIWIGKTVTYYKLNEATGQYEKGTIKVTDELLKDPVMNIHIGSMILQNYLIYAKYNIPQAIQSYNQGIGAVDRIVRAYCQVTGKDFAEVRATPTDLGWTDYRYLETKGNPKYLECVNRWLPNHTFTVTNVFTKEPVSFKYISTIEMEPHL